jgi:hypothetical protein
LRVKVEVTERDIKKGAKLNCNACPIALATKRALYNTKGMRKYSKGVSVVCSVTSTSEPDNGRYIAATMPVKASNFIDAFDSNHPVKPFSMTLNFKENN